MTKKIRDYLSESKTLYKSNGIKIRHNVRNKGHYASYIEKRLNEKSNLSSDDLKVIFEKVIEVVKSDYDMESGIYVSLLAKSEMMITFFIYRGKGIKVITILDW